MKLLIKSLVITALSVQALGASAAMLDLGVAGQFNAFIFNDFIDPSGRVDGALAVGNHLQISSYSINSNNKSVNGYGLVVGKNLNFTGGDVFNGNLYAGGTINTSSFSSHGGIYGSSSPVDFASEKARLTALSNSLQGVASTGTVVSQYSGLYLTASNGVDAQVFNVSGVDFFAANNVNLTGFQNNQTIIFNISGDASGFNGGVGYGFSSYNVLFNFYQATSLDTGSGANGSVLAPFATLTGNSTISGNVIANNWSAGTVGAGHYFKSTNVAGLTAVTPVPEADTFGMLLAGLSVMGLMLRRKKQA